MISELATAHSTGYRWPHIRTPGRGPGIKDMAAGVKINGQFMAGFLAALEERGEISCGKVGSARIYFNNCEEGK